MRDAIHDRKHTTFVTKQTKVAALGYLLIYIAMAIEYASPKSSQVKSSHVCMISTPIVMISVLYGVNCAVKGHCNTFAWMVAYFFLVTGMLALIFIFSK